MHMPNGLFTLYVRRWTVVAPSLHLMQYDNDAPAIIIFRAPFTFRLLVCVVIKLYYRGTNVLVASSPFIRRVSLAQVPSILCVLGGVAGVAKASGSRESIDFIRGGEEQGADQTVEDRAGRPLGALYCVCARGSKP